MSVNDEFRDDPVNRNVTDHGIIDLYSNVHIPYSSTIESLESFTISDHVIIQEGVSQNTRIGSLEDLQRDLSNAISRCFRDRDIQLDGGSRLSMELENPGMTGRFYMTSMTIHNNDRVEDRYRHPIMTTFEVDRSMIDNPP